MKKTFLGLRTTIYRVPNLNEAKAWYTKVFETNPYFDEPFYVGFDIGGYELGLLPEESGTTQSRGDNVLSYWGVENVQETFDKLLEHGASKHGEPQDVGDGIITAEVTDPWGNLIGIIYNPHFKVKASG